MEETFRLFPIQASTFAEKLDRLYWFLIGVSGFFATLIIILVITFAVVYRRRPGRAAQATSESMGLELIWTAIPLMLVMVMFVWGSELFLDQSIPPKGAEEIFVVGKQWMWKIQHSNGRREINELHVPVGRAVKLTVASQDVIHSFFIPAFRVKQDVLPGRYTQLWFTPTRLGTFPLTCAEYCGLDHSKMGGAVIVLSPAEFARWLKLHGTDLSLAARGAGLFRRSGCGGCHGSNSTVHAPALEGVYGRPVHLADGATVMADERYLHDSITLPNGQVVAGYAPVMPSFAGQLSEEDLLAIIAYLKSISVPSNGGEPP